MKQYAVLYFEDGDNFLALLYLFVRRKMLTMQRNNVLTLTLIVMWFGLSKEQKKKHLIVIGIWRAELCLTMNYTF